MKILGVVAVVCAALAARPGLAQEDVPATDRDVPRANGGTGDGVAIKGFRAGPDGGITTNGGPDPVRPEGGSIGLQRRANLKTLIVNAPKIATGSSASNTRIGPQLPRPGADGAAARNAIGVMTPGGHTSGDGLPSFTVPTGGGVTATGTPGRNAGGADLHRGAAPLNADPTPHAAGLNGTSIGHIGSGPGSIGGPAKDRSGINGTFVRPNR